MTQPDRWDEVVEKLMAACGGYILENEPVEFAMVATALRSAYAEGEKAGMERAEVMRRTLENIASYWLPSEVPDDCPPPSEWEMSERMTDCILSARRAAKETKE